MSTSILARPSRADVRESCPKSQPRPASPREPYTQTSTQNQNSSQPCAKLGLRPAATMRSTR